MPDLRAAVIRDRTLRAMLIERFPELAEPEHEETLIDTLSGISNLDDEIVAAMRWAAEREEQADALDRLMDRLAERKARMIEGRNRVRAAVLQAMQDAGRDKIAAPDMTVGVRQGPPKVHVAGPPELLPDRYVKTTRTPILADIAKALLRGEPVPGASLGNGTDYLAVNRK